MTFYEAAVRVLEEAGTPLNAIEITQRSMTKGLLSHIGKTPELTMLSRLAAMAKRPRDRKVMITAKDTFALSEWMLPEDADAAATTGVPEENPEESLPALRPLERHPEPRAENARGVGRQGDRKHRSDERRRRYPPVAEVVFEIMSEAPNPHKPEELLHTARVRELASDDLNPEQLLMALLEDNQRRIDAGRRPHFVYEKTPEGDVQLTLDRNSERPVQDIQTVFATALGVPVEDGRVVLKKSAPAPAGGVEASPDDLALIQTAKHAVREARRAMARVMRRRLGQLEQGDFEKACVKLLHAEGMREVKVAKRSKEGPLMTARCREGNLELRYAVRVLKGSGSVDRRHVQDLRRDLSHYGAHVGLLCSSGDARGDARSEATGGGALIFMWCGDALAEKFFDAKVGVKSQDLPVFELDEAFFVRVHQDAQDARARREERARDRGLDDEQPADHAREDGPSAAENGAEASSAPRDEGNDNEGSDEGDDEGGAEESEGAPVAAGSAPGAQGEGGAQGRRRRRRRRRRGGRGGTPGAPGAGGPRVDGQAAAGGGSPEGGSGGEGAGAAPSAPAPANDGPQEG